MSLPATLPFKLALVLSTAVAAMHPSASAGADVLTFNDLGPSTVGTRMPALYHNLRWNTSDWHYMSLLSSPDDSFLALSGNATFFGSQIGGPKFYFDGADFWSRRGLDANGDFYFVLYLNGATVYNGRNDQDGRQRFSGTHQLFVPNYTGLVDGIAMAFDSGRDDWNHLAMDNIRIRPASLSCSLADIVDGGGAAPGDGAVEGSDLIAFINAFAGAESLADLVDGGGTAPGDGTVDGADFIAFINAFAAGC